jgi:hypothetical protein
MADSAQADLLAARHPIYDDNCAWPPTSWCKALHAGAAAGLS